MDTSTGEEDTVTMMDVLREQEEIEENVNAVLGSSDDKNCTYSEGYIKRQALYACQTCTEDTQNAAAICLACSLKCHDKHELVELYTKRNFRCDCPTSKLSESHSCNFVSEKMPENKDNQYNQNFQGLYCICHRPYPDPESTEQEKMIQCVVCEDWLHSSHLEARVPQDDQYSEMICKSCMTRNDFLYDYPDLMVECDSSDNDLDGTCENSMVDICETDETENGIENATNSIQLKITDVQAQEGATNDANDEMIEDKTEKVTDSITESLSKEATDNTPETDSNIATDKTTETPNLTEEIDENKDILDQINEVCNDTSADTTQNNCEKETKIAEDTNMQDENGEPTSNADSKKLGADATNSDAVNQPKNDNVTCPEADSVENVPNIEENAKDSGSQEDDIEKKILPNFTDSKEIEQKENDESQQNTKDITNEQSEYTTNRDEKLENEATNTVNNLAAEPKIQQCEQPSSVDNSENSKQESESMQVENTEKNGDKIEAMSIIEESSKEKSIEKSEANINIEFDGANNKDQTESETIAEEGEKDNSINDIDTDKNGIVSNSAENEGNVVETVSKTTMDEKLNQIADNSQTKLLDQSIDTTVDNTSSEDQIIKQTEGTLEELNNEVIDSVKNLSDNSVDNQLESMDVNEQNNDNGENEHDTYDEEANVKNASETLDQVDDSLGAEIDSNEQTETEISKGDTIENNDEVVSNTIIKENDPEKESNIDVEMPLKITDNTEVIHETTENNIGVEKESNLDADMLERNTEKATKRKFDGSQKEEMKKPKLESQECIRRRNTDVRPKGATFWICNWRTKLCTCSVCIAMYKDLELLYLLDPDDTVTAYEQKGKEKNGNIQSQYEQGLHAFQSRFDRVEQINAMSEYNSMRDKLVNFLQWFKDNKQVVKEEDVKRFFRGMRPTRKEDGVYFCI